MARLTSGSSIQAAAEVRHHEVEVPAMEVTFHPFDPDLAQHFAAAWRRHPGDAAAITADLHAQYPEASIGAGAEEGWHVYREFADGVRAGGPDRPTRAPVDKARTSPQRRHRG
jgi:hypothetical protein